MTTPSQMPVGTIAWADLTVPDAASLRDFYCDVLGWRFEPVDMGSYSDFSMLPPSGDRPVAGVCHARGINADIPPQWMIYVIVDDLPATLDRCRAAGGRVLLSPDQLGEGVHHAIIQDPAGAVMALYQPGD